MPMHVHTTIEEYEIAQETRSGNLRLEHILQYAFDGSEDACDAFIENIEAVGGTAEAGNLTKRFAEAMIET